MPDKITEADLSILMPKGAVIPPPETPLSCYLLPEFWRGAQFTRNSKEIVKTQVVAESTVEAGTTILGRPRHTREQVIMSETPYQPSDNERTVHDDMVKALGRLERAAASKRDLSAMAAYHRWLAQGTAPVNPTVDLEE